MGCCVLLYEKRDNDTYQDVLKSVLVDCQQNPANYEQWEIQEIQSENLPLAKLIGYSKYKFIDGWLCLPLSYDKFLFRTFLYDDPPLHSLEETIAHIDKYVRMKKRKPTNKAEYTYTHQNTNGIEFNETYENTIELVKEFWSKHPNSLIKFG